MPTMMIKRLSDRVLTTLHSHAWIAPLAIRLAIGLAFAQNGWNKLHHLDNIVALFKNLGIPAAEIQAPIVSAIEFAGGVLLMLGLGTRVVAALLVGVMTVATLTAVLPQVGSEEMPHLWNLVGTIEITYLVIFIGLVFSGGGAVSLDRLIRGTARVGEPA